jgi:SAM-dependent methyltransferase
MTTDPTISCYDRQARAYDLYQAAVVPRYQEALDMVAEACQRYLGAAPRILDLGCGTGNASASILRRVEARIFLLDGSRGMVELAENKIGSAWPGSLLGSRVADLFDGDWDEGLGKCDAVISTFVLEHLPFDVYRGALKKCYELLNPGGWLIAVEGYDEDGSDMLPWFNQQMEDRRQGLDPEISEFVARLREEREVHYYSSKAQKKDWWREAGFQANVLWQYLCIALMAGRKPP